MHWQVLVFVIVAAVLILSHVFGKAEQPRRRPPGPGGPVPGGRPQSEIERFLEEVSRKKRRAADEAQGQTSAAPAPPPPPRPAPVPQRVERMPRPVPTAVRRPEAPPRERPPSVSAVPPPVPAPVVPAVVVPAPPATLSTARVSPTVAQLRALLRSPHTLRTAVILHEVLGPPRCRRR